MRQRKVVDGSNKATLATYAMTYSVELRPSGNRFEVSEGGALLDAALDAGLSMPFGCRNAICRACEATLLEGEVSYPLGLPAALSSAEVADGKVLLCQARACSNLVVRANETAVDTPRTLPCRVVEKQWLTHDVLGIKLALRDGENFRALPGQYVDVVLRDGRRRAFSVANPITSVSGLELQIRVVPGGEFSGYAAEHLKERALLRIHGPLGGFFLRKDEAGPAIFIAGGTGFAPIKAIIEDAFASGWDSPMHLYWGVRSQRDLYHQELVHEWTELHPNFSFTAVLSEPGTGTEVQAGAQQAWAGRTGFVHDAVLQDFADLRGHAIYLSGPPIMIQAVRDSFSQHGMDSNRIYADSFDYAYVTGHDEFG